MHKRYIITSTIIPIISIIIINNNYPNVSSLTYQDSVNLQFTFTPTLSITITGDNNGELVISSLTPGSSSDSNIINVGVSTNNVSGYNLSATVGDSTNNPSSELRHSSYSASSNNSNSSSDGGSSSNSIFTSLNTTDSYSSFDDKPISPNTWGYSYATSYDTTSSTYTNWSNYSGLPLYNQIGTVLKSNYSPVSNDTVGFKIAAKAANNQIAGEYTNTINFIATVYPSPMSLEEAYAYFGKSKVSGTNYYAMQDLTPAICQSSDIPSILQVLDLRDNSIYHIAHLRDNNCWMLDNLALDPTMLTQAELYGSDDRPLTNASNAALGYLKNGGGSTDKSSSLYKYAKDGVSNTQTYSYSAPLINASQKDTVLDNTDLGDGNHKIGVYYNYCAASAGSYCYGDGTDYGVSTGNATEDLCPAGWRLPTGNNSGEYYLLYNTSEYGYHDYTAFRTALSLPISGISINGSYLQNGNGYWWTSSYNGYSMYSLIVDASDIYTLKDIDRSAGISIRCIHSS